jgi:hypothetical protein
MKKAKIVMGLIWAFAGLIMIVILFPGLRGFSKGLATLPFMKINPRYSGGIVAFSEIMPSCTLVVHKPVFRGLWKERTNGFVQVDWRGNLPEIISDTIDYDMDGSPDFAVIINTVESRSELVSLAGMVENINISSRVSYGWALRVNLKK